MTRRGRTWGSGKREESCPLDGCEVWTGDRAEGTQEGLEEVESQDAIRSDSGRHGAGARVQSRKCDTLVHSQSGQVIPCGVGERSLAGRGGETAVGARRGSTRQAQKGWLGQRAMDMKVTGVCLWVYEIPSI